MAGQGKRITKPTFGFFSREKKFSRFLSHHLPISGTKLFVKEKQMKYAAVQFITIVLIVNCFVGLFCIDLPEQRELLWQSSGFPRTIFTIGMAFAIFTTFFMLLQAVLAAFYRAKKPLEGDDVPACTVVVPAYNESEGVMAALRSIMELDYPQEKLEIIAVNDGSKDDTWEWIQRAVDESGNRIRGINLEKNGGKKAALCYAIRHSKNPVIVTVDSDSVLEKGSLRSLLAPMKNDESIGAVAGTIRVKNMKHGILPRMLDVFFVFGCDFMRCAQSVIGYVLCTPGAISAYRRDVVTPLLDRWLAQTFFGAPATIGEDRALTSLILRSGKKVVSQSTAVAYTQVPDCYTGLCKMLLRWNRGDMRESILLLGFVLRRWSIRDWRWSIFQLNIVSMITGSLLPFIFIPCTIYTFIQFSDHLLFMVYYVFSINSVWSLLPAAIYARRNSKTGALWAFVYGIFSLIALSWICIYSILTLRNSSWLTREKQ